MQFIGIVVNNIVCVFIRTAVLKEIKNISTGRAAFEVGRHE